MLGGRVDNQEGPVDTQGVTNGHSERTDGHQEGLTDTLGGALVNQEGPTDTHEKQGRNDGYPGRDGGQLGRTDRLPGKTNRHPGRDSSLPGRANGHPEETDEHPGRTDRHPGRDGGYGGKTQGWAVDTRHSHVIRAPGRGRGAQTWMTILWVSHTGTPGLIPRTPCPPYSLERPSSTAEYGSTTWKCELQSGGT